MWCGRSRAKQEDYTRLTQAVSGPIVAMVARQSPTRQAEIWRLVTEAARQYATADGAVCLPNECRCVVGRRQT